MGTDARLIRLNDFLISQELDAYLITQTSDIRWVTGFEHVFDFESAHALLVSSTRLTSTALRLLHTDARYFGAMKPKSAGVLDLLDEQRISHIAFVAEQLKAIRQGQTAGGSSRQLRIGVEAELPLLTYRALRKGLDEAGFEQAELVEITAGIKTLRAVKDAEEIAALQGAQAITDATLVHMLEYLHAGLSEAEAALELEFSLRRNGSEGVAFAPILASGPNSAIPHHHPSQRLLQNGDYVLMDFGARLNDYCSDMTRTVVLGAASERQKQVYDTVLNAQLSVLGQLKAGVANTAPQAAVDQIFATAGFGPLSHGLGHGVGIDIHEAPVLSPLAGDPLAVGNVVTVEPGIYLEDWGGVRIEDFGAITADGFNNFTHSSKQLIEL
ncbi:MAG: Xaa-Pro peptidase family protein [Actinomycetia bacterium]|nr:Xaa-Pro peptidase family protein [Actinomycetes bacterium]